MFLHAFADLDPCRRQRLRLASVLLWKPPVLLLDEPMTYLDERSQQCFVEMMRFLRQCGFSILAAMREPTTSQMHAFDHAWLIGRDRFFVAQCDTHSLVPTLLQQHERMHETRLLAQQRSDVAVVDLKTVAVAAAASESASSSSATASAALNESATEACLALHLSGGDAEQCCRSCASALHAHVATSVEDDSDVELTRLHVQSPTSTQLSMSTGLSNAARAAASAASASEDTFVASLKGNVRDSPVWTTPGKHCLFLFVCLSVSLSVCLSVW